MPRVRISKFLESLSVWTVLIFSLITDCRQPPEYDSYYYESGQLKEKFELHNEIWNGEYLSYFENGKLRSKGMYRDGKADGLFTYYHENGQKKIEGYFKRDLKTGEFQFFDTNGKLWRIEYFGENGDAIDFEVFKADGSRDFSEGTKRALIVPNLDTLKVGKSYEFEVRLGNRQFDRIEVKIGDANDKKTFLKSSLPNKDSLTAIMKINPRNPGDTLIRGVVLDLKGMAEKFDVITFVHKYVVMQD